MVISINSFINKNLDNILTQVCVYKGLYFNNYYILEKDNNKLELIKDITMIVEDGWKFLCNNKINTKSEKIKYSLYKIDDRVLISTENKNESIVSCVNIKTKSLCDNFNDIDFKLYSSIEIPNELRGKIITLEGLDGSFKETNAKALCDYLNNNLDIKATVVSFPRYDKPTGKLVKKYLNGEYKDVNPYQAAHLYAMDRLDFILSENVKERLENGEWFIFDRYVESNLIHQASKYKDFAGFELANYILDLEYKFNDIPRPDIIIYLKSNFDLIKKILLERNETDIHESNLEYLEGCFKYLNKLCSNEYDNLDLPESYVVETCGKNRQGELDFRSKNDIFLEIIHGLFFKNIL